MRSLYSVRLLIEFCDTLGYRLAEEFFWFNPAKLPSPIEWIIARGVGRLRRVEQGQVPEASRVQP